MANFSTAFVGGRRLSNELTRTYELGSTQLQQTVVTTAAPSRQRLFAPPKGRICGNQHSFLR